MHPSESISITYANDLYDAGGGLRPSIISATKAIARWRASAIPTPVYDPAVAELALIVGCAKVHAPFFATICEEFAELSRDIARAK